MTTHNSPALPPGSKLWLLNLGTLDISTSNILTGTNTSPHPHPESQHNRRELSMIAALIHHPGIGLILFDTGSCEDILANWKPHVNECLPRIWNKSVHGLPEAIAATGAGIIADVRAVVLSHLHLDHAGGLEHFVDSDVEIWCHEQELKYAFWACATGIDSDLYMPHYLQPDRFNWNTFNGEVFQLWRGVTLHHTPGHTEGSIAMEVVLAESGPIVMTGDLFHVKENWEEGRPQGFLLRDWTAWHRSLEYVRRLVGVKRARVLLGHEMSYFRGFGASAGYLA